MFENIGRKIKGLAEACTTVGIILFVILGIVCFVGGQILAGILTIILGILASWLSSICLYGFGELVDKATEIAENTRPRNQRKSSATHAQNTSTSHTSIDTSYESNDSMLVKHLKDLLSEGLITEEEYQKLLEEKG